MKGIYLINEKFHINGYAQDVSVEIQHAALLGLMHREYIVPVKLNPYQLNQHYTIPHALLFDLKLHKKQIDCLLMYSTECIEDFAVTYPARWLILKSYFDTILTVA